MLFAATTRTAEKLQKQLSASFEASKAQLEKLQNEYNPQVGLGGPRLLSFAPCVACSICSQRTMWRPRADPWPHVLTDQADACGDAVRLSCGCGGRPRGMPATLGARWWFDQPMKRQRAYSAQSVRPHDARSPQPRLIEGADGLRIGRTMRRALVQWLRATAVRIRPFSHELAGCAACCLHLSVVLSHETVPGPGPKQAPEKTRKHGTRRSPCRASDLASVSRLPSRLGHAADGAPPAPLPTPPGPPTMPAAAVSVASSDGGGALDGARQGVWSQQEATIRGR